MRDFVQSVNAARYGMAGLACACQNAGSGMNGISGMGSIQDLGTIGTGPWQDTDTGHLVQKVNVPGQADGFWDPINSILMNADGQVIGHSIPSGDLATSVPGSGPSAAEVLGAPGQVVGAVQKDPFWGTLLNVGTQVGMSRLIPGYGKPAPAPVAAPSGPSLGTVALVVLGIGAAGYGASKLAKKSA